MAWVADGTDVFCQDGFLVADTAQTGITADDERRARKIADSVNAVSELAKYFTSGNSVPVERATIRADDFWRITGLTPNAGSNGPSGVAAKVRVD